MDEILNQLVRDCRAYRAAVDSIFSGEVVNPSDWRRCLFDIQICVARLQLDRLIVHKEFEEMQAAPPTSPSPAIPKTDVSREMELRHRIKHRLEASPVWTQFNANNPMAELFGLRSVENYLQNFALHLPEIYEETFRIEELALLLLAVPRSAEISFLLVALQHAGQNHIPILQPALDRASDEDCWN